MAQIRLYTDADQDATLALFGDRFGARSAAVWRWLYHDNPAGSASVVAVDGGRVVGHFGGVGFALRVRGERYAGVQHVDFMVDRDAARQDRGLADRLMAAHVALAVPGRFEVSLSFPARGVLRRHCSRHGYRALPELGWHTRALGRPGRARPLADLEDVDTFAGWADALYQRWAPGVDVSLVRDAAYLDWRWVRCPEDRYRRWRLVDRLTGDARGWVVLRPDGDTWEIVDLLALRPWADTLLSTTEARARDHGARRLRLRTLPDTPLARWLLGRDYRYEWEALAPAVQVFSPHLRLDDDIAARWYLLAGDSDRV